MEDRQKIVVFTGAGVSAESGLSTFRDSGGLWEQYSVYDVATPEAWARDRELVLRFYNARREGACAAQPNAAHRAIAALEKKFDVTVVTQNVDDLHERGGSSRVIHLHGELTKARSTVDPSLIYEIGNKPVEPGDKCEKGSQLRPHIVWFGEMIMNVDPAAEAITAADRILVVGTSLSVYPAAGLLIDARPDALKVLVALQIDDPPAGYQVHLAKAGEKVPEIVTQWLAE